MGQPASAGGVPAASRRAHAAYETAVRHLSDRLAAAQRPLRVLDAVRWGGDVEGAFFAAGGSRLPPVTRDYYSARPLPFDPGAKRHELRELERDARRRLGPADPAGRILIRRS